MGLHLASTAYAISLKKVSARLFIRCYYTVSPHVAALLRTPRLRQAAAHRHQSPHVEALRRTSRSPPSLPGSVRRRPQPNAECVQLCTKRNQPCSDRKQSAHPHRVASHRLLSESDKKMSQCGDAPGNKNASILFISSWTITKWLIFKHDCSEMIQNRMLCFRSEVRD